MILKKRKTEEIVLRLAIIYLFLNLILYLKNLNIGDFNLLKNFINLFDRALNKNPYEKK